MGPMAMSRLLIVWFQQDKARQMLLSSATEKFTQPIAEPIQEYESGWEWEDQRAFLYLCCIVS